MAQNSNLLYGSRRQAPADTPAPAREQISKRQRERADQRLLEALPLLRTERSVPHAATRIVQCHQVMRITYKRHDLGIERIAKLALCMAIPLGESEPRPAFLASYENTGNGFYACVYAGPSLDEAIREMNVELNKARQATPFLRSKPPFLRREDFEQQLEIALGRAPA